MLQPDRLRDLAHEHELNARSLDERENPVAAASHFMAAIVLRELAEELEIEEEREAA